MALAELEKKIKELGLKSGDKILVTSDLLNFFIQTKKIKKQISLNEIINILFKIIGKNGTIIVPSFTYSINKDEVFQNVDLEKLVVVFHKLMEQTKFLTPHDVKKDFLSVREKMTMILNILKQDDFLDFKDLLDLNEGKSGLIVSFLAILELIKLTLIDCVQANQDSAIFIKLK